eukprot:1157977-Pelagomonas_calceolata.AAC.6
MSGKESRTRVKRGQSDGDCKADLPHVHPLQEQLPVQSTECVSTQARQEAQGARCKVAADTERQGLWAYRQHAMSVQGSILKLYGEVKPGGRRPLGGADACGQKM